MMSVMMDSTSSLLAATISTFISIVIGIQQVDTSIIHLLLNVNPVHPLDAKHAHKLNVRAALMDIGYIIRIIFLHVLSVHSLA